jgi:predicted ArsR family transcriptional regulator
VPTSEGELTERKRDVLRLVREGKNPTEIGKELEISSQGVHGHLRRLRTHGLIEEGQLATAKPAARKPRAAPATSNARPSFDPASTIRVVVQAINEQRNELDRREEQIDAEIARLQDEKRAIGAARKELHKLIPAGSEAP